jgi:hypothetical protein
MLKLKKKVLNIFLKLTHDRRNFHDLDISKNFINNHSSFKYLKNINLSDDAINRVFQYAQYLRTTGSDVNKKKDLWDNVSKKEDRDKFMNILLSHDKSNFLHLIENFNKSSLAYGFSNYYNYHELVSSKIKRKKEFYRFVDTLISFAEYRKLIKVYNIEQGGLLPVNIDYNNLIKKVFSYENKKISTFNSPNYFFGFKSDNEFYFLKDLKSYYSALKLNNIINLHDLKEVNEIGGGLGYTSYYFNQINKKKYNLYDIPYVSLSQACFLLSSNNSNLVHLAGEEVKDVHKLFLRPYWKIFDIKECDQTLWFNQDSFPEINLDISKKYIDKISTSKKSYLFSINQEACFNNFIDGYQHPVHELISGNKNFKLLNRSRDFLRNGYIEELYKLD